jgi:hypothetical protein
MYIPTVRPQVITIHGSSSESDEAIIPHSLGTRLNQPVVPIAEEEPHTPPPTSRQNLRDLDPFAAFD